MDSPIVKIKEHTFILSPSKTIYWQNKKTLLVSDTHFGKSEKFIKNIIPIPFNIQNDLNRLKDSVSEFDVGRIIILGDLFHIKSHVDKNQFKDLLTEINKEIVLILGNHDVLGEQAYAELGINRIQKELREDMFLFTHKPDTIGQAYHNTLFNFHGHLHPGIKLNNTKNNKIACFVFNENTACLPAFGGTTGKHSVATDGSSNVYAISNDFVRKIY